MTYMQQVEAIRVACNYTKSQMAVRIGIGRTVYSRLCSGRRRPTVDTLGCIVRAFPMLETATWDYVRGRAEVPKTPPDSSRVRRIV